MAKAKLDISKLPFLNPLKLPDEFVLQTNGNCMHPIIQDGEFLVVDKRKKIQSGDLAVIYFKPEFVKPGGMQAMVKRAVHRFPAWGVFPFRYEAGRYGDFGPVVIFEQINPRNTFPIDLRSVLGVYHAALCPSDVIPVMGQPPKAAILKRPTAARAEQMRREAA